MSVYFDASVIVSMFVEDAHSLRIDDYISRFSPTPTVSDFAMAEVASALSQRVRARLQTMSEMRVILGDIDVWRAQTVSACHMTSADVIAAETFLRRFDLPLRAPDAIHIAISQRLNLQIASFDRHLADSARRLGLQVADA